MLMESGGEDRAKAGEEGVVFFEFLPVGRAGFPILFKCSDLNGASYVTE